MIKIDEDKFYIFDSACRSPVLKCSIKMKDSHEPDIFIYSASTSLCAYRIEPPYTERYVRWCERTATQLMLSFMYLINSLIFLHFVINPLISCINEAEWLYMCCSKMACTAGVVYQSLGVVCGYSTDWRARKLQHSLSSIIPAFISIDTVLQILFINCCASDSVVNLAINDTYSGGTLLKSLDWNSFVIVFWFAGLFRRGILNVHSMIFLSFLTG